MGEQAKWFRVMQEVRMWHILYRRDEESKLLGAVVEHLRFLGVQFGPHLSQRDFGFSFK